MEQLSPLHGASPGPWDAHVHSARSMAEVPDGIEGLQQLALKVTVYWYPSHTQLIPSNAKPNTKHAWQARHAIVQGCWKAVAEQTRDYKDAAEDQYLASAAWHIFALAKLRMYREAEAALAGLGDLDAPHYTAQTSKGAATGS